MPYHSIISGNTLRGKYRLNEPLWRKYISLDGKVSRALKSRKSEPPFNLFFIPLPQSLDSHSVTSYSLKP